MRINSTRFLLALGILCASATSFAQTTTTGAVQGSVKDADGSSVIGATVVATSPVLQGTQAEITDENGDYFLAALPPGTYEITVYYGEGKWSRTNVIVSLGKTKRVNISINTAGGGETVVVEDRAPLIDQGSTKTGVTITEDYSRNIPTGQTFIGTLGAAAGSQGDLYGVSFGGSTSVENVYIVNGLNTTDALYGLTDTNLPNEFIRETEIITGGYQAEYGRATGAVINVVTKTGSNEFHGQLFSYFSPGALVADATAIEKAGSAFSTESNLSYDALVGMEVGGPIVKDKLWFHVGFSPQFTSTDQDRIVSRNIDENGDGIEDFNPDTGIELKEEVARTTRSRSTSTYFFTGNLTFLANQDHQGSLSFLGNPRSREFISTAPGPESATHSDIDEGAIDVSGKWSSKFNNNKTQLDAVIGLHSGKSTFIPAVAGGDDIGVRFETYHPMSFFESIPGCEDGGADDPYPMIDNCPVIGYRVGGTGVETDQRTKRLAGVFSVTQRVKLAGHHQFKLGADFENNTLDSFRHYTGGTLIQHYSSYSRLRTFLTVDDQLGDTPCGSDINGDGTPDAMCAFQANGLTSDTTTRNVGAYLQDSWSVLPNLTLNLGVRWEQQTLFVADHIVGMTSPTTGEEIPDKAFTLSNMIAPRLGAIYDWTAEGRSKVFAHWGRFYESIPMDINDRAYGGEVIDLQYIDHCADLKDPTTCDPSTEFFRFNFGGGETLVAPGMKAQYLDEMVAGVEYEIFEDFSLGATYIYRTLGRVIEDVSTDDGNTYIVANPGEVDQGEIDALREEAAELRAGTDCDANPDADACLRASFLEFEADQYDGVKIFDKPNRTYNALQITAKKRFSRNVFVQASYTYSKTKGNFPGLFSPETGQLDPNLTSMYDLPELMANRYGDLSADRPHSIKIDGYYTLPVTGVGTFVFGGSFRGISGIPVNTLGGHFFYGPEESYILPRGTGGRTPFTTNIDTRVAYRRSLGGDMWIEGFADVFNLFNQQPETAVDNEYTLDDTNPIVGGTEEDLAHAKVYHGGDALVTPNKNHGNTTARSAPFQMRFGIRLTF